MFELVLEILNRVQKSVRKPPSLPYIRTQYIIVIYQHGVMVVVAYTVGKGMETAFGRQGISSNTSGERSGTTPERV